MTDGVTKRLANKEIGKHIFNNLNRPKTVQVISRLIDELDHAEYSSKTRAKNADNLTMLTITPMSMYKEHLKKNQIDAEKAKTYSYSKSALDKIGKFDNSNLKKLQDKPII